MTAGRRIGSYEVVRELGRGGMGVVHEVRDANGRRLALKLILAAAADSETLLRFRREAELLARVSHPNVVRVHSLDVAPEGPFLVTELVEGRPLSKVTREGPLGPREAAQLVRTLADAVEALHARGVLHRDLKPPNVIVRPDGSPVLLDFGIARDLVSQEKLTATGTLVGTPVYMAPEQADGTPSDALGPTVDVYGLGALLLEALSGHPPFDESKGPYATLKKVMHEQPRWPSSVVPDTPPALESICRVAMSRRAADRYASAAALRDDLDRYLRGAPPLAVATPRSGTRRLVAGAAALALGAVALGAVALGPSVAHPDTPPPTTTAAPSPTERLLDATTPPAGARPLSTVVSAAKPGARLLSLVHGAGFARGRLLPDARALTFGEDKSVALWALEDPPRELARVVLDDVPLAVIVVGERALVRTWSSVVSLELPSLAQREARAIEAQPQGRYTRNRGLALSASGLVAPGQRLERLDPASLALRTPLIHGDEGQVLERHSVAAHGDLVVVGGGSSWGSATSAPTSTNDGLGRGELRTWRGDVALSRQTVPTVVTCVAIRPGETPVVACGMFSGFLLLDALGDDPLKLGEQEGLVVKAHQVDVQALAFSPDGALLLSAASGELKNGGAMVAEVRAWSTADGSARWRLDDCDRVLSVDCADVDGRLVLLLGTTGGRVDLWRAPP